MYLFQKMHIVDSDHDTPRDDFYVVPAGFDDGH